MEFLLYSIEDVLRLGPEEWEEVAETHATYYPSQMRDTVSLRRKFQSLYNSRIPTGDPSCPAHVQKAKRLRYQIEHRSDASNLEDGNLADLGFDDDEEEEDNGEEGNAGAAQAPEGGTLNRVLFDLQEGAQRNPRPLVRTPRAPPPGSNAGGMLSDVSQLLMTSLVSRMQREDSEREERRQAQQREGQEREERRQAQQMQQQMNMTMFMAVISAVNPAACSLLTTNMARIPAVAQNNNAPREEESSGSQEDGKVDN
jgi:hypothetical protein